MRSRGLVLACLLLLSASVLAQHTTPGAPATTAAAPPPSPPPPPPPPPPSNTMSPMSMTSHIPSEPATPRFEPPSFHPTSPSEPAPPKFEAPTVHSNPPSSPPLTSVAAPGHGTTAELPKAEPSLPHSSVRDAGAVDIKHSADASTLEVKPVSPVRTGPAEERDKDKTELRRGKPCPKDKSCGTAPSSNDAGKNQTTARSVPVAEQCQSGTSLNGVSCIPGVQACAAGTTWNGAACVENAALCGSFRGMADNITAEARGTRSQMDQACLKDPNSDDCIRLTQ